MIELLPEEILFVLRRLNQGGFEAFLVGGCTRDYLLNLPISDFDVTTSALPEQVMDLFQEHPQFHNGLKHGTVSLVLGQRVVEVTTFRIDSAYSDARHPDSVTFTRSLREDVARRDFTMNGIAYGLQEGFVDYFGGKEDLRRGIIRAIGNPDLRFAEDALRILRAVRFASVLGFAVEASTARAMDAHRTSLALVSAERKAAELSKALLGKNIQEALLQHPLIFAQLVPEIEAMQGFDQKNPYHVHDLLTHTALCIAGTPPDLALRLAALFHDTGKPATYSEVGGTGHFYGHEAVSAGIAQRVMRELKFGKELQRSVLLLVQHHDRRIQPATRPVRRLLNVLAPELFFKLLDLKKADFLAQSPAYASRIKELEALRQIAQHLLEEDACFSIKNLAVNGHDLMALGLKGPALGQALEAALEAVLDEKVPNQKEALLDYLASRF